MANKVIEARDPHIDTLLDDIRLQEDISVFQKHLERSPRLKVQTWVDGNGLDFLHHAILEKNVVVVASLFHLDYFKPPHEASSSWLYLHLAAVLGQRAILSMLLQERPHENKKQILDWDLFHKVIVQKIDVTNTPASIVPPQEKDQQLAFLPVDLAARYGHLECVKTLLDSHIFASQQSEYQGRKRSSNDPKWNHMAMACSMDSAYVVRLLLTKKPDQEQLNAALTIALKTAKPECLDALLRYGADTKQLFEGMNLYHVLFCYSQSFHPSWFESLVKMTSVLIRHGLDVNACRPSRTFPLYSLLSCIRVSCMKECAPYIFACLLLLLQAGADPGLDEVLVEQVVKDEEYNTALGRPPYPSALHCLVHSAANYVKEVSDPDNLLKYVYSCAELLLRHGADASYVGRFRRVDTYTVVTPLSGNVLHALCDAALYIGDVDSLVLLLLLRHGANPDALVNEKYPLTLFFEALCRREGIFLHEPRPAISELVQDMTIHDQDTDPFVDTVPFLTLKDWYWKQVADATSDTAIRGTLSGNVADLFIHDHDPDPFLCRTPSLNEEDLKRREAFLNQTPRPILSELVNDPTIHDHDIDPFIEIPEPPITDEPDPYFTVSSERYQKIIEGDCNQSAPQPACQDHSASRLGVNVRKMCRIIGFMSLEHQYCCANDLRCKLKDLPIASNSAFAINIALRELDKYTLEPPSLRRSCAITIWRLCRRHVSNVYSLPIPPPLVYDIFHHL